MSGQTENIEYGTKFDYSKTSAYRRKLKREKKIQAELNRPESLAALRASK